MSERIEEIRKRLEGISQTPWAINSFTERPEIQGAGPMATERYPCRMIAALGFPHVEWSTLNREVQLELYRDAELIANAPGDIRFLLDEVERLSKNGTK